LESYYQQIRDWRDSECQECSSKSICPGSISNIKMCLEEGPSNDVSDFRSALIIRTMRVMCSKQRKMRRSMQGVKGPSLGKQRGWGSNRPVRTRAAHIYCSDRKEFSRCLQ